MKNCLLKRVIICLGVLSVLGFSVQAHAALIKTGVIIADWGFTSLTSENVINQSGLDLNYVNGADFGTYVAQNPLHYGSSTGNGATANLLFAVVKDVSIDFDFGKETKITDFGLWNDNDWQGIYEFNLDIANNPGFSGATSLGSFTANYGPLPIDYTVGIPIQTYDLNDTVGRYVRMNILSIHDNTHTNSVNFGEVIFGVDAASVPEPSLELLLGISLVGLVGVGTVRKIKQKAVASS